MVDSAKTELLIIKAGDDYVRFREEGIERCQMNKGSVFPLSKVEDVKCKCNELGVDIPDVQIMKLTIVEEPFVS